MKIYTTAPLEDPREARHTFRALEEIGYDGAFSFEAKHDPFLPLVLAAEHTQRLQLGTAVAIAFARNPMNLANLAYGLQLLSQGRFMLGLGSQVGPHIRNRFSMPWSEPAKRMREIILAIKAIFARWEGQAALAFEGEFYRHTLMIPAFDPGPNPFGPPPVYLGGFGPRMTAVAGEVADGLIAHPFNTRESLLKVVLPGIEQGLARSGRKRAGFDVICATLTVTADGEEEFEKVKLAARKQLDPRLSRNPRLPRLGRPPSRAQSALEAESLGRHDGTRRRRCARGDRGRRTPKRDRVEAGSTVCGNRRRRQLDA